MSDANNEINFTLYMPVKKAKGITLYKNGKSYYSFSSTSSVNLSLKADDYISIRSDTNDDINITVGNNNTFDIDVKKTTVIEVTYGIGTSQAERENKIRIGAKSEKNITLTKLDKIFVSKVEKIKRDIKDSKRKDEKDSDMPGSLGKMADVAVKFRIYADKGSKLYLMVATIKIDGEVMFLDKTNTIEDKFLSVTFGSYDDYFICQSGGNVKLENINNFPITVRIQEKNSKNILYLNSYETKSLELTHKVSKVFVIKKQEIVVGSAAEPAKFTLDIYGEQGVQLFRNGKLYFSFKKKKLSGVQVHLQDNDTIDIGPDKDYRSDPELGVTYETVGSPEIRRKKRRLIVRNKNDFFIIVRGENYKLYIIASNSEAFIFFGKDTYKLYILKGLPVSTNRLPARSNLINIYISFYPRPPNSRDITIKAEGGIVLHTFAQNYRPAELLGMENNYKFTISVNEPNTFTTTMIVASDPSNQNIMIKPHNGSDGIVIKPGGVEFLSVVFSGNNKMETFQVSNRMVQKIHIHEVTNFMIPFKTIPYIRMSTSMQVDLLNTSIYDVQAELQKERKRKGEVGDCDLLTKMLYSVVFPFKDNTKESTWPLAVLLSHERGLDKVLITAMALAKQFEPLAKYLVVRNLLTKFLNKVKSSDYYKSNVIDLLKKDFSTFLFELNINKNGFIVCMYRPARKATLWEDPWRWFSELPTKIDSET